jgi:hypothetical protein
MKYTVEMGSVPYIHTKFHKDWLSYSEVDKGDTQTAWRSHKPTFIFFKIRKVG